MVPELKVLFSREQIAARVAELGEQITKDFAGEPMVLVGVLKGAAIFLERPLAPDRAGFHLRLYRRLHLRQPEAEQRRSQIAEGRRSVHGGQERHPGRGHSRHWVDHVLLERSDSGAPSPDVQNRNPVWTRSAAVCSPSKPTTRGLRFPMSFVVGYGMDYAERYRNLPDICVVP